MLPEPARNYVLAGLDNTPLTLAALVSAYPASDPVWDTRPDPDRFSLREIVAHLADWETVWGERWERGVSEEMPRLPRPTPQELDRRATEKEYATADPHHCLTQFSEQRAALTNRLRGLPADSGSRPVHLERLGDLTLDEMLPLVLGHDGYHLRQVAEWLKANSNAA